MATMGTSTATPTGGSWSDSFGNKQFSSNTFYTMPAGGGIANSLNIYCAGFGGSVNIISVVWDHNGNIFYQTPSFSVSSTLGWKGANTIAGTYIPAGTYLLGFWSASAVQWEFGSTGGEIGKGGLPGGPGSTSGGTDEYGGQGFGYVGAYVDYTPIQAVRTMRGGLFVVGDIGDERTGAFGAAAPTSVMRSNVWVQGT